MPNDQHNESPKNNSKGSFASSSGNELMFQFEDNSIHVEMFNGEPVFLAKDVCDALGLGNNRQALANIHISQKLTLSIVTAGQARNVNFVTESGLYALIFKSRKEEALIFQDWVTGTVLPALRKYGIYCTAFMQLELSVIDGREMFLYEDVRKALGFKKVGSATGRRETWPNEFTTKYNRVFVTIPYANLMASQRGLTKMRADLKAMPTIEKEVSHG